MVWLRCQHCGHKWNYGGKQIYRCTCPRCGYKVNIRKKYKPYVCELCGSEIPEGGEVRLEDGDTILCGTCAEEKG